MNAKRVLAYKLLLLAGGALLMVSTAFAYQPLRREDLQWLQRITYGVNDATLAEYERLGRSRFLDAQFQMKDTGLPPLVDAQIEKLAVTHADIKQWLAQVNATNQQIKSMQDDVAKQDARKTLNDQGNQLAYEAARRHLLYALYSPAQLREQLVWFWLNHFSVLQNKDSLRWLVGDYEAAAIRPYVFGNFRDLVMDTLQHPAMLQYLDNAQNAAEHINENYARELMELHTLGVDAGYTQQDVQELARILTGVGINANDTTPKLKPEWQHLYVHQSAFEFNPARHDFGQKTLLSKTFQGGGMDEVAAAIDWLIAQPACAHFVSRKLASYFLGIEPSAKLQEKLSKAFQHSHGNIEVVLRTLFDSREFMESLGREFKDPMHFVISAVRFSYDGKIIVNTHPIVNWLNALGEPLYGRQTPDGYPLSEASWASSGQLSKRFEIARAIASGNAGLFDPEDGSAATSTGFPQLANRTYYNNIESLLSAATRAALSQASSQLEWNTYLLSSPDFNYH